MAHLGGKMAAQVVKFGGNGIGQVLAAAAAALLLRLFSGPGPALSPEDEFYEDETNGVAGDAEKVVPVTISWSKITCSLSDKSNKQVSSYSFSLFLCSSYCWTFVILVFLFK